MAYTGQVSKQQRAISGGGALVAAVAVGLGLASGLDLNIVRKASEAITAHRHPRTTAATRRRRARKGRERKGERQGTRRPTNMPRPRRSRPLRQSFPRSLCPSRRRRAPVAGNDPSAGATPTPGPGSGAGGRGDGTGAGGTGSGTGGGTTGSLA